VLYLDTSYLVPLFLPEVTSERVERFLGRKHGAPLAISHWTRVEFLSALAREVRMGSLTRKAAHEADAQFSETAAESFLILLPTTDDFDLAGQFLRQHESGLRAGDALHLAIASNNRATAVYTLDRTFLAAGRRLGLKVSAGIRLSK
jgi:predicted nucleic acid-binding protein